MPEADETSSPDPVKGLIEYGDDDKSGYGVEVAKEETPEDSPEKREERQARSIALEKAYVHEVYQRIAPHFLQRKYRAWPRVKQFLLGLEPGSLVADVGCGGGKYLDIGTDTYRVGCDRCSPLLQSASQRGREVTVCDNLQLPFREESFDAALSVAVVHHFATTERRIKALQELARILRIGGRVLITVWAMEQRHRRFESQDVLVPWHQPTKSSSEDRTSSVEHEMTSTTTSDDDLLVYNAYTTHTSDSDGHQHSHLHTAQRRARFRDAKGRYRGRSLDFPRGPSSPSSSELSSPNETCYSFVRRALKKLSSSTSPYNYGPRPYFYGSCRKPWFTESTDSNGLPTSPRSAFRSGDPRRQESQESESAEDQPIELRHLDGVTPPINSFPSVTQRSRTPEQGLQEEKTRSLGDILGIIPSLLRSRKAVDRGAMVEIHKRISTVSDPREYVVKTMGFKNGIARSKSTVSCMARFAELKRNAQEEKREEEEANKKKELSTTIVSEENKGIVPDEKEKSTQAKIISPDKEKPPSPKPPTPPLPVEPSRIETAEEIEQKAKTEYIKKVAEKKTKSKTTMTRNHTQRRSSEKTIKERQHEEIKVKPKKNDHHYQLNEVPEEESEGHMATYYSMPELHNIDDLDNGEVFEPEPAEKEKINDKLWEKEVNTDDTFDFDDEYLPGKNGFVKRSFSVDTGDRKGYASGYSLVCERQRRFSASAAQGNNLEKSRRRSCGCSETLTRSASRGSNSLKSDASLDSEESIVSVIPRKCNSIQSDTSVDSEESIISVIQRSTSELETLSKDNLRKEAITRSAQTSPLTICGDRSSVSSDNTSDFSAPNSPLTLSNAKNEHFNAYLAQTSPPILQDCQYKYDARETTTFLDASSGGYSPRRLSANNNTINNLQGNSNGYYRHVHAPKALHLNNSNNVINNKEETIPFPDVVDIPKLINLDEIILSNKFAKKEKELNVINSEKNSPPKPGKEEPLPLVSLLIDETKVDGKTCDATRVFECSALLRELVDRVCELETLEPKTLDMVIKASPRALGLRPILQRSISIRDNDVTAESTVESKAVKSFSTNQKSLLDDSFEDNTPTAAGEEQIKAVMIPIKKPDGLKLEKSIELTVLKQGDGKDQEKHHQDTFTEELNFEMQTPMQPEKEPCLNTEKTDEDKCKNSDEESPQPVEELSNRAIMRKRFTSRGRTQSEGATVARGVGSESDEPVIMGGVRGRIRSEGRLPKECFEMDKSFPHNCLVVNDIDPDEICDEEDETDGHERLQKDDSSTSKGTETPLRKMDSIDDDSSREIKDESESSGGRLTRTDSLGSSTGKTETSLSCRPPLARNSSAPQETDRPDLSRNTSLSLSTSQESLQGPEETEGGGGSVTLHRYYHVFREGELDHLIETYVENLHIISSYYDHTNWCVIAEKVQVWTI